MLKSLLRVRFAALLAAFTGQSRKRGRQTKGKAVGYALLMLYCFCAFVFLFYSSFSQLAEAFFPAGLGWLYFAMFAIMAFALMFIGSVFTAKSQLFEAKDNELLLSMPVPPGMILLSRMAALLAMNFVLELVVALPVFVSWLQYGETSGTGITAFVVIVLALLAGCLLTPSGGESEPIQEVMRDAVLHEQNKVSLFGLIEVNPGLISAYIVTGILIVFALVCRLFVIPKFKYVPGRFQLVLEQIVGMFDGLAEGSSPHRNKFLRAYIFTAGVYIFVSTLFELLGIQVVTTSGHAVSLPAPLSDINGAIALGVMSYGVILFGGLIAAGVGGFLHALKDFSLPISMSFRLFGALLSGALVTELVYYYAALSYVLPVIVGVMFTLLHALIQAYVLTMLVSTFYGESTEKHEKKPKAKKMKESRSETAA